MTRSNLLQAASGRYAEEIVVPGGQTTVSNPTGKATVSGSPLRRVPASRYLQAEEVDRNRAQLLLGPLLRFQRKIVNNTKGRNIFFLGCIMSTQKACVEFLTVGVWYVGKKLFQSKCFKSNPSSIPRPH